MISRSRGLTRRQLLASAAATSLLGLPALAQNRLGKAVYGQGSIDPFFAAGYVALKKGYFGANGLDVEYLHSQSGPRTNQLLAAGQILFVATAAPALRLWQWLQPGPQSVWPHLWLTRQATLIGLVLVEFVGSTTGMGYLMITALATLNATDMFATVTLLSVVEIVLVYCVTWLERRLLHWAPEFRE